MLIKWLGHSCFKITGDYESVVLDPFGDGTVSGYRPIREEANMVLCSHLHGDHNAVGNVHLIPMTREEFSVERIESFHDDKQGRLRGENTIHLLEADGYRLAHLGDLGCKLTADQIEQLKDLDVLMIPVGGYYTIDADQAADIVRTLRPRITIPMHYRSGHQGYDVLAEVDQFTRHFDKVLYLASDSLEISDELQDEIVVLDYPHQA